MKRVLCLGMVMLLSIAMASCGGDGKAGGLDMPKLDLLTAIDQGKTDIVRQHMQLGTDPNKYPVPVGIPLEGAYPLHLAVVKGNKEIVQILLDNSAQIDLKATDYNEATPLHWAAFFGQKGIVELLIESGAPINALDANAATPLDSVGFVWFLSQDDDEKALLNEVIVIIKDNGGVSGDEMK